jgi:hypothetical protein
MGIIDRQLPTGFIAFLKYIFKHVDANKVKEFIEHYEREKAINRVLKSIKQIDPNQLLEIIRDMDGTAIVTAATVFIAVFSGTLWWVNRRQGSDARVIQRAYVKISHSSPGVEIGENGNFWHQATVKNFGQTPARVTDVVMKPLVVARGKLLPTKPDYTCKDPGPFLRAFLVRDDEFFLPRFYSITPKEMQQVKGSSADLYVIGFVDYIDQFGVRHRAGYGRRYDPAIDAMKYETAADRAKRNNLHVVVQKDYNYDRPRRQGEGKDWDSDT